MKRKIVALIIFILTLYGAILFTISFFTNDEPTLECVLLDSTDSGIVSGVNFSCRDLSEDTNQKVYVYEILYKNIIAIPRLSECSKLDNEIQCETIETALIQVSDTYQDCPSISKDIQAPFVSAVAYDAFEVKYFCAMYDDGKNLVFIRAELRRNKIIADKKWIMRK